MKKKLILIILIAAVVIGGTTAAVAVVMNKGSDDSPTWQEQYDLGVRYLSNGNYEEAVIAFTAAIEIDPKNPDLYIGRADAYMGLGDTAVARADYETALELDENLADAWLGLAETYIEDGNLEKALEILREASEKMDDERLTAKIAELEELLHVHTWAEATCTTPKTCTECGETEGEPLGHTWKDATCTEPKTCNRCGMTDGAALGHDMQPATVDVTVTGTVTGFYAEKTNSVPLKSGEKYTFKFKNTSNGTENWENFILAVVGATGTAYTGADQEILIVRADNWGWGGGMSDFVAPDATDGNKLTFGTNIVWEEWVDACQAGVEVEITISRDGDTLTYDAKIGDWFVKTTATSGVALPETVYVFLTGHNCTLTGITASKTSTELAPTEPATTNAPSTCSRCGYTEGEPLSPEHVHTWAEATCTEPRTCTECGATDGKALGHNMLPATTDAPSTCSRCGHTEGEPLASGITWTLKNGTLTISGVGPMEDCKHYDNAPWSDRSSEIERVIIENGVTTIGSWAFSGCDSLTSVEMPNSVTTIGEHAFYSCDSLTSIYIPNSVTMIGFVAFYGCQSLTNVEIPDSVTTIGAYAFECCYNLQNINVKLGNPNYASVNGVLFSHDMTLLIAYPAGREETSYEIPDSVTTIGTDAFYACQNLTSVTIPNSVTTISEYAFCSCDSLTSVTIPNSVTTISDHAFYFCDSLTNVTIPNSVTTIGSGAFYGCGLTSVTIPNSVTTIGDDVFSYCFSLTSVEIPASVSTIGTSVFSYCRNLADIYYGGTAEQWAAIAADAKVPETTTIHYNYSK